MAKIVAHNVFFLKGNISAEFCIRSYPLIKLHQKSTNIVHDDKLDYNTTARNLFGFKFAPF